MANKYKFINEVIDGKKTHCHTYGGAPMLGTSSVVNVISKNLTWWSAELAAVECLEVGEKIPTIREEYLAAAKSPEKKKEIDALCKKYPLFKKARYAHYEKKNDSADAGTDMHEELEKYIKWCLDGHGGIPLEAKIDSIPQVLKFSEWSQKNVEKFIVSEGYCYSERLWLGGITDCYALLKNGHNAVIDFKSSKEAYISQFIQVCLYDIQISENGVFDQEGNRMFEPMKADEYIIFPFGATKVEPSIKMATEELKEGAEAAVKLYKLTNSKDD